MSNNRPKELSEKQQFVLKNKGTEAPFSGILYKNDQEGTYVCADCSTPLFASGTKFESGSGWPSFYDVMTSDAVKLVTDTSHGMIRTEVVCSNCGGHLGHVFDDGPTNKTGKRYCINSCALDFVSEDESTVIRGDGEL